MIMLHIEIGKLVRNIGIFTRVSGGPSWERKHQGTHVTPNLEIFLKKNEFLFSSIPLNNLILDKILTLS